MEEKLEKYISTGSSKAGSNRIKMGMLPVLFQKRWLNGKYCWSNCLISTFTRNMSLYFVIAIVQSLSVSIREFFGKNFSYTHNAMYSTYALCSQKSKMVTDMALKFQEIFIKGLFFSVLLVKSSSRIMVEIDMKKNDAAPFPPSKLLLKKR